MSTTAEIKELYARYVLGTYAPSLALARGEGAYVWDADGKQYLDFGAGIAVCILGHCHPAVVAAVREQAGRLMHVSNLYFNEPQAKLARRLVDMAFDGKCFFANSGAAQLTEIEQLPFIFIAFYHHPRRGLVFIKHH